MSLTVDVIVPVYGNWSVTNLCLSSLEAQTMQHRVIVVDDKSPDDTIQQLRAGYPNVELIELDVNSGFATASNRGLASATADIVILVNNDVQADPRMIEQLVSAFADERVGSAAPLLTRPDGMIDAFGITCDVTLAGFLDLHGASVESDARQRHALLGPYGAVAAYRRLALDQVGLLDEGIFMYGEELDLALRLSAAGWRPAAVRSARGVHLGGATAGAGSATQRERAGFGRGYILRAYGVLGTRHGLRAVVTELIVCVGDAIASRDLASARGRIAGWRAGRYSFARSRAIPDVDRSIGFVQSLRLRVGSRR